MTDIFHLLRGKRGDPNYNNQPVIIQGITGSFGSVHTKLMMEYGTNIVAGVVPKKGGQKFNGVPIYNTMKEAVSKTGSKISVMFVPAPFFLGAAQDALNAGIKLLIAIPEHVPVIDTMQVLELANKKDAMMIGPNTPGLIIPDLIKLGIMPVKPFTPGNIVVLSKSGTLLYEISNSLSSAGFGQLITVGVGGDPINGMRPIDMFEIIRKIKKLEGLVIVGEIGGDAEELLAQRIIDLDFTVPTVAFIAGRAAPKEKRMGHAGAIIYGDYGSAESKIAMFNKANIPVAKRPSEIPILLSSKFQK